MKQRKVDPDTVVLVPTDIEVGVSPGDGTRLGALLRIRTDNLGDFVIPLTAHDVGFVAASCKTLLGMSAEQATQLQEQFRTTEGDTDD